MKRYFCLQLKRTAGSFIIIAAVSILLALGVSLIITAFSQVSLSGEEHSRFRIALCGDTEGDYIELGLKAIETFDDTRFTLDILKMSEDEAAKALSGGTVSAYVVLPEDFIEKAVNGVVEPVTFVTSAGQSSIATMVKDEITYLIRDLLVYSQKGTYAVYDALRENGASDIAYKYMNVISIEYAELVFSRSGVYSYRTLGISDGLGMNEYYVCALSVLLVMLMGIPFAVLHIRSDRSLDRILLSRGYSEAAVLGCEYALHALCMLSIGAVSLLVMGLMLSAGSGTSLIEPQTLLNASFILRMIPAVLMISALDILLFECQDNIVGGVVMHFFITLCMGYACGCMYPVYALPGVMQTAGKFLPAGLGRSFAGGAFTYEPRFGELACILLYTLIFLSFAYCIRLYKTRRCER